MKGKVNCTCGWSWNKSDSSAKDMYICHECGRNNSNNMKNGGWLNRYDKAQPGITLPSVRDLINDTMNRKIQAYKGKGKETNVTKKDNVKTVKPKISKVATAKEKEQRAIEENKLAYEESQKEAAKDWVQNSMQEAYQHPLMSPGYFTPEGAIIGALQAGIHSGVDLSEGDYKGAAINAGLAALPFVPKILKTAGSAFSKAAPVEEGIFSTYVTPKEAAVARAERMLSQESKWNVNSNSYTKDKFTNINDNFEEVFANEIGKSPQVLGTNAMGKAFVFKDNGLSPANQSRVAAHETGHFYRNMADEANEWNSFFDFSKLKHRTNAYLRGKPTASGSSVVESDVKGLNLQKQGVPHGDEIRERAAQLKDYIAQKNGIPLNKDFTVTQAQLDDAIENYVKDTNLDNSMSPMLNSLKDKKGFLKAMNKYALGAVPLTVGVGQLEKQKNGGWLDNYDKAQDGEVVYTPPKSQYKRLYGHATDYSQGKKPNLRIDPDTGYGYFPQELSTVQQKEVPNNPWNITRFLFDPLVINASQGIHNSKYDKEGNIINIPGKDVYEEGRLTDGLSRKERYDAAKKDITSYYKEDLKQNDDAVEKNVDDTMDLIRKMRRTEEMMQRHNAHYKDLQNPEEVFRSAVGFNELFPIKSMKGDFKINPRQAKRAYKMFQKTWRGVSGKEARQNSREELKKAQEAFELTKEQKKESLLNPIKPNPNYVPENFANGGTLKNGGWLDNYNDSQASAPEGMVGDGYSNVGRNYSPAWGGSFQGGGKLGSNIPVIEDSGNFNKEGIWVPDWKTMAAQAKKIGAKKVKTKHGSLIVFDDNWEVIGVDDNPDAMQMGGSVYPVNYVPQAQNGYRMGTYFDEDAREREPNMMEETYDDYNTGMTGMMKSKMATQATLGNKSAQRMMSSNPSKYIFTGNERFSDGSQAEGAGAYGTHYMSNRDNYVYPNLQDNGEGTLNFIPNASSSDREAMRFENPGEADYFANHYKEVAPMMKHYNKLAMGGSIPGSVGFTYARTKGIPSEGPYAKKTMPSAKNGGWLDGYEEGGVIKGDQDGYRNPKNRGKVVEIEGDTMGTDGYDDTLYVVPDVGEPRMVYANTGNHEFPGATKFREYPMAKNGIRQEQKGLQNLDNLVNFTNYNKPTVGGWLNKYN